MKILVASDIHGSALYCGELLKRIEVENPDKVLLLGDLLYHGPRNALPGEYDCKKVADMLNSIKDSILCVRGNCDAEVDQMMLEFPIMADYIELLTGKTDVFATHGHLYGETNPPPIGKGDILLCGHTHVPALRNHGTFTYMNPGSVSIPKSDSYHSYMIMEDGVFEWKTLDGMSFKPGVPVQPYK